MTVLVVEDEALIRMDASDALEDAGFSTLEAANADEALDILRDRPDIDVVFTDVNMPGSIDGIGLMKRIASERPEICMIIASGMERPTLSSLAPRTRFFAKPYAFAGIIDAIHALRNS
jgi:CheY-like chemotaxis protein